MGHLAALHVGCDKAGPFVALFRSKRDYRAELIFRAWEATEHAQDNNLVSCRRFAGPELEGHQCAEAREDRPGFLAQNQMGRGGEIVKIAHRGHAAQLVNRGCDGAGKHVVV